MNNIKALIAKYGINHMIDEIYKDPELYAVIDDFRGFYPKYLED